MSECAQPARQCATDVSCTNDSNLHNSSWFTISQRCLSGQSLSSKEHAPIVRPRLRCVSHKRPPVREPRTYLQCESPTEEGPGARAPRQPPYHQSGRMQTRSEEH